MCIYKYFILYIFSFLQISEYELQFVEGSSPFRLPWLGHLGDFGPELQRFEDHRRKNF